MLFRSYLSWSLLKHTDIEHLTMVDQWLVNLDLGKETFKFLGPGFSGDTMRAVHQNAIAAVSPWPGRTTIMHMNSLDAAKQIPNRSMDFVIIDASHEYAYVRDDIDAWYPKVRKGGWLLGDDCTVFFPGVVKAVDECFPLAVKVGPLWATRK